MRKVVAALNMTIDGIFDHTAGIPDEAIHKHYTELLGQGDAILYGRTTYQLMQFWQTFLESPSDDQSMNEFAAAIDKIPKIVFSRTLNSVDWESATLAQLSLKDEVLKLKEQSGNDIFVGSRSLIVQLLDLGLIDEFQLCIYPVVVGQGMSLFQGIGDRKVFDIVKTKSFNSGSIILYYQPKKNN